MLSNIRQNTTAFSRVNRKGQVVRVLRERYLRSDIRCQSHMCSGDCVDKHTPVLAPLPPSATAFSRDEKNVGKRTTTTTTKTTKTTSKKTKKKQKSKKQSLLSSDIDKDHNNNNNFVDADKYASHYLVPENDVALKFVELFEHSSFRDIIFTETVTDEAKSIGRKTYQRIRDIVNQPSRRAIVFNNEHFVDTYIGERQDKETLTHRNQRAVRQTALWYGVHLKEQIPIIVLTLEESDTEGQDFRDLGQSVFLYHLPKYLDQFHASSNDLKELYDSLLNALQSSDVNEGDSDEYPDHLSRELLERGLATGKYLKGVIHVNKFHPNEAYIKNASSSSGNNPQNESENTEEDTEQEDDLSLLSSDVIIMGRTDRNRAIHGDIVAIEMLPQNQWVKKVSKSKTANDAPTIPTGRVVGIVQRNWRPYVACLQEESDDSRNSDFGLCIPMDVRIPKIRMRTKQRQLLENSRIVVRISKWEKKSRYPTGFFVRNLGDIGNLDTETEALLLENGITYSPFSATSLEELNGISEFWTPSADDMEDRRDLRETHKYIMSIDPVGCEDIDDALSVRELGNDHVEIGVHIADVSHFVKANSHLDMEARNRALTVYLPDRRLDMLPSLLSSTVCSLRMNEDRYAVSVLWQFSRKTYKLEKTWFGRTLIKSRYALHYAQAQELAEGRYKPRRTLPDIRSWRECIIEQNDIPIVSKHVRYLLEFAHFLRQHRTAAGSVELESIDKVEFDLDNKSKTPKDIHKHEDFEVNKMVAEWMIYANSCVAREIYNHFPGGAILRRHPFPPSENFNNLVAIARSKGFHINYSSNKALADSLSAAVDPKDPTVNMLLRSLATRAMAEAEYFCTGSFAPDEFYHYGLAIDFYTHFTSPIRRYADVLVHRMLLVSVEHKTQHKTKTRPKRQQSIIEPSVLEDICEHINTKHRSSKNVERESNEWFRALYFRMHQEDPEFTIQDAVIYSIRPNGVFVFIDKYNIQAPVFLTDRQGAVHVPKDDQDVFLKKLKAFGISDKYAAESAVQSEAQLKLNPDNTELDLMFRDKILHKFRLFDHITVQIVVNTSRAHRPSLSLEAVSVASKTRGTSSRSTTTSANKGTQSTSSLEARQHAADISPWRGIEFKDKVNKQRAQHDPSSVISEEYREFRQVPDSIYAVVSSICDESIHNIFDAPLSVDVDVPDTTVNAIDINKQIKAQKLQRLRSAAEKRLHDIDDIRKKHFQGKTLSDAELKKLESEPKYRRTLDRVTSKLQRLTIQ